MRAKIIDTHYLTVILIMKYIFLFTLLLVQLTAVHAQPTSFSEAKSLAKQQVYFDRNDIGTTYCDCKWRWVGKTGGRIDFASCGYQVRAEGQRNRAERLEWEHVLC